MADPPKDSFTLGPAARLPLFRAVCLERRWKTAAKYLAGSAFWRHLLAMSTGITAICGVDMSAVYEEGVMKAAFFALVLGIFLDMSTYGGQVWPVGSVVAVVIMGVWIKVSMDRRFEELERRIGSQDDEKDDQ